MSGSFAGIWAALVTPLDAQGRVECGALRALVAALAQDGLDGLYVTGSTGQWPLLALEERRQVVEQAVRAAGSLPVMAHVAAPSTQQAVELARHAAECGAAAVSSVSPSYYHHPVDAVFEYWHAIGAAAGLPLFVYHLEGIDQISQPLDYAERLMALPHAAGLKYTSRDLYTLGLICQAAAGRLAVFSGADELMCHAQLCGTVGAIGTFYNVWGRACRHVWQAVRAGNLALGQRFMGVFQAAIHQILNRGCFAFLQTAIRIRYGIDVGRPRPPLAATDRPWHESEVRRLLEAVDAAAE
ncbi:MAG: dihydrodipicolinate synthase family protein [Pirellulales bacterium]|nr:dihydrodipicolinate synthase family protein [Pirellulales bacterium]